MNRFTIYRILGLIIAIVISSLIFILSTNNLISREVYQASLIVIFIIFIVISVLLKWDEKRKQQPEPYEIEKY